MKSCILNALQFKNNLKLITISHYMRRVSSSSYDEDDREFLPDFIQTIKKLKNKADDYTNMCHAAAVHCNREATHQKIKLSNVDLNVYTTLLDT